MINHAEGEEGVFTIRHELPKFSLDASKKGEGEKAEGAESVETVDAAVPAEEQSPADEGAEA